MPPPTNMQVVRSVVEQVAAALIEFQQQYPSLDILAGQTGARIDIGVNLSTRNTNAEIERGNWMLGIFGVNPRIGSIRVKQLPPDQAQSIRQQLQRIAKEAGLVLAEQQTGRYSLNFQMGPKPLR